MQRALLFTKSTVCPLTHPTVLTVPGWPVRRLGCWSTSWESRAYFPVRPMPSQVPQYVSHIACCSKVMTLDANCRCWSGSQKLAIILSTVPASTVTPWHQYWKYLSDGKWEVGSRQCSNHTPQVTGQVTSSSWTWDHLWCNTVILMCMMSLIQCQIFHLGLIIDMSTLGLTQCKSWTIVSPVLSSSFR